MAIRLNRWIPRFRSSTKVARNFLLLLTVVALLAPVLANHLPLMVSYKGHTFFPAFDRKGFTELSTGHETIRLNYEDCDWNELENASVLYALIRYSPGRSDFTDAGYTSPIGTQTATREGAEVVLHASERHWLGTGKRGDDILAGIIHGTRVSLSVAMFSMLIAGILGIFLGAVSGYYGDQGIRMPSLSGWLLIPATFAGIFYANVFSDQLAGSGPGIWKVLLFLILLLFILRLTVFAGKKIADRTGMLNRSIAFPADTLIIKTIELISSLPVLLLILAVAAVSRPSVSNLIWIIGLTSWTEIARLTRAEVLKIREMDFVSSARAMGLPSSRIIFTHVIPNALTPVLVALSFGAGGAILAESGLSFLGIGVAPDTMTWGRLIADGRQQFDAWWLVVFPGLLISSTVMAFYSLGKRK